MSRLQLSDIVDTLNNEKITTNEAVPSKQIEEINDKFEKIEKLKDKGFNFLSVDRFQRAEIKQKVAKKTTKDQLTKWQGKVKKFREAVQVDFTKEKEEGKEANGEMLTQNVVQLAEEGDFSSDFIRRFQAKNIETKKAIELENQLKDKPKEDRDAIKKELMRHKKLMVQAELKAKRLKKIKSKMYRRIRRKQKEKEEQKDWEQKMETDHDFYLEEMEKVERKRADLRASTKHNKKNKFTRLLKKYGGDKAAQEVIREIHDRRKQVLKKAIELEQLYGEDAEEEEAVVEKVQKLLKKKGVQESKDEIIDILEKEFLNEGKEKEPESLFEKIMKKGESKVQKEAKTLIEKLENGDSILSYDLKDEEITKKIAPLENKTKILKVKKNEKKITAQELFKKENDSEVNIKMFDKNKKEKINKKEESNLMEGLNLKKLKKKQILKETSLLGKRNNKKGMLKFGTSEEEEEILEVNALDEDENKKEIELEKEQEEGEKNDIFGEKETIMTGWGEWAGGGVEFEEEQRKKREKLNIQKKKRLKAAIKKRKDGKFNHVMVNTKRIKDTTGLYLQDIPFEFENKSQVNFVMSQPIGVEWNGQLNYKRNIRPKMKTKAGKVIRPLSEKSKEYKLSHF